MIKGDRIYLRLMRRADINILCDICNDYNVNKYNNVLPNKKYLFHNFHMIKNMPNKILTIINEKKVVVGFIDYRNNPSLIYTIGISIGKRFWGRGYGQESIKVLSDYLFKELYAKEVIVEVIDKNKRAIKCCKKCGFNVKEICTERNGITIIKMHLVN